MKYLIPSDEQLVANAEFVAKACNLHDELVAACIAAERYLNFSTTAAKELKKQLRTVIARASEGTNNNAHR